MANTQPGDFVWYDLLTSDPAAALAFYTHVVGWTTRPMGPNYTMFASEQGPLAGTTALPDKAKAMGAPPHWTANVQVADLDTTLASVEQLGGKVYHREDVPKIGRIAVIGDPQGAPLNVFQPESPMTARDRKKPGELAWHELMSAEHETAFVFYNKLFGWTKLRDFDMGAMGKYLIFGAKSGGADVGGMMTKPKEMPVSAWGYYIQVAELDATLERAKSKGAKVLNGPMEVPGGAHVAQLSDPQGAMFALHEESSIHLNRSSLGTS